MRKKYLLIVAILIILITVYLNRSYAYIYKKIDEAALKSPDNKQNYFLDYGIGSENITYVAIGDSLTAGVGVDNYEKSFPFLIAKNFAAAGINVTFKNRSFAGARTAHIKEDFLEQIIKDQPDIVTILIGVNDIHGLIKKTDFKNNYEYILKRLSSETKAEIYIIAIPYLGAGDLILPPYNFYFDWQTKQFNETIKDLSKTYQIKYIDLYSASITESKKSGEYYASDSFHPSEEGYSEWAKIIYDDINK